MKVHKGDTVIVVVSGKDKVQGQVIQAFPQQQRVLVGREPDQEAHRRLG